MAPSEKRGEARRRTALSWRYDSGIVASSIGDVLDLLTLTDRQRLRLHVKVINLTNQDAVYNFLSTFSGTHFVAPRTYHVQVGWTF